MTSAARGAADELGDFVIVAYALAQIGQYTSARTKRVLSKLVARRAGVQCFSMKHALQRSSVFSRPFETPWSAGDRHVLTSPCTYALRTHKEIGVLVLRRGRR